MAIKTEGEVKKAVLRIWLDGQKPEPISKARRGKQNPVFTQEAINGALSRSVGLVERRPQPLNRRQS